MTSWTLAAVLGAWGVFVKKDISFIENKINSFARGARGPES